MPYERPNFDKPVREEYARRIEEFQQLQAKHDDLARRLADRDRQFEAKYGALERQLADCQTGRERLQAQVNELEQRPPEPASDPELVRRLEELEGHVRELLARATAAESEAGQLRPLADRVPALEGELRTARSSASESRSALQGLTDRLARADAAADDARREAARLDDRARDLARQLDDATRQLDDLARQLDDARGGDLGRLEAKVRSLNATVRDRDDEIKTVKAENASLRKRLYGGK